MCFLELLRRLGVCVHKDNNADADDGDGNEWSDLMETSSPSPPPRDKRLASSRLVSARFERGHPQRQLSPDRRWFGTWPASGTRLPVGNGDCCARACDPQLSRVRGVMFLLFFLPKCRDRDGGHSHGADVRCCRVAVLRAVTLRAPHGRAPESI